MPERQLPCLSGSGTHKHSVVGDVLDTPRRGAEGKDVADARLVHHLFVEFPDALATACAIPFRAGEEDAVEATVGDGAAVDDGQSMSSGAGSEEAGVAIPHQARSQLGEGIRGIAACEHVEHRLEQRCRGAGDRERPDEPP